VGERGKAAFRVQQDRPERITGLSRIPLTYGGDVGTGPCRVGNQTYAQPLDQQGRCQQVVGSMGDNKQPEANAHSPDKEEEEELRRILQSDDIAPVDYTSYGKRAAQIILHATIA
jgi:hypothetical protein